MREFKALSPRGLADASDASFFSEEPVVTVKESKRRITISYLFPGFYTIDESRTVEGNEVPFQQINIEGAGFIGENGKPQLPSFGRYVQIPFGCDYKVTVYEGDPVEFDKILVKPTQAELTDNPDQQYAFAYDKETYSANKLFPSELACVSEPYQIDGYTALLLHVCPLQYNPAKNRLIGYSNIDITIDLTEKRDGVDEHPFPDPENGLEGFGNLFLNPRRHIERRLHVKPHLRPIPSRLERVGPELLIIYHPTFKSAAKKLNLWKRMNGLRSDVVSIESVPNYSAAPHDEDRVTALKTYIRKAKRLRVSRGRFQIPRLRYVLLFGDVDMIASETISNDSVSGGVWGPVNISDYYYATSKDPESPTEMVFPCLALGRIPVRTAEEGASVADQIIQYEKNPPCDPDYYQRLTFAALFQDKQRWDSPCDGRASRAYMRTMEDIRERMVALGFDVTRVYVKDCPDSEMTHFSDGTVVPQEVKDAVVDGETATGMLISETSEGQLLIAHRDHGMQEGWHMPSFTRQHLNNITSNAPSIFFSLNCQTGWFDRAANRESFAENLLRIKGGAPSLIAATRNSSTSHNDEMMKALFDALWGGVLPTFPSTETASYAVKNNRLGDILNYGKSYLPIASHSDAYNKDHFEIYHVIGDPSLELWKEEPRTIGMKVRYGALRKRGGVLSISLDHCPKGSVVTIWHGEKMIKRIEPSSTQITLPLKDISLLRRPVKFVSKFPMIFVCFGAPGYRFRQARVHMP